MTGDRRRVEQALLNLLSNALKFTDRGGAVSLSVDTWTQPSVTGGIEPDDMARLFRPFELLEAAGYDVRQAVDGPRGVALAGEVRPALILLDIRLRGMDGYSVAPALKSNPALATIPIVAVTSHAMVGDCEAILAAGCEGCIEEPIAPDTFVDTVCQHMRAGEPEAST